MADIALTAAMRTNLLTLQSTQEGIDKQQAILATGRKVNSALDNPSSFFAAQSLNNRANDLSRLLDGMGQNISAIKQADKGVTSLTKLVEQADAIANQAQSALTSGSQEASVTGSKDLTSQEKLVDFNKIATGDKITFKVTDPSDGSSVSLANSGDVTITGTMSAEGLAAAINELNQGLDEPVLEASISEDGKLQVNATNGGKLKMTFDASAGTTDDINLAKALGFENQARELAVQGNTEVSLTALAGPNVSSVALYSGSDTIASASTEIVNLQDADGNSLVKFDQGGTSDEDHTSHITIGVNGGTAIEVADINYVQGGTSTSDSVQKMVDTINSNVNLNGLIKAEYDESTGQLNIRSVSASVTSVEFGVRQEESATSGKLASTQIDLGFGTGPLTADLTSDGGSDDTEDSVSTLLLGSAAGQLARLESDYDSVRTQIDQLVSDAGYQGVNLLNGDTMTTNFNENRTSSLTTKGVVFTSSGLGIGAANFGSGDSINSALTETRAALNEVRNFGSTLANDLSVIQTRQDFTKETINNLKEGSDKLTLADKNEEGAKLLALQTQQQLGVISLSMASQSSQSVLRLF